MCAHMVQHFNHIILKRQILTIRSILYKRMASSVTVKSFDGDDRIKIRLKYCFEGKPERIFNLERLSDEEIGQSLGRLQANMVSKLTRIKGKKKNKPNKDESKTSAQNEAYSGPLIEVGLYRNNEKLIDTVLNKSGWRTGSSLKICDEIIPVIFNPPSVKMLKLEECYMSGFPIRPIIESDFTDSFEYSWYLRENLDKSQIERIDLQNKEELENLAQTSTNTVTAETSTSIEMKTDQKKPELNWVKISTDNVFMPDDSHINHYVKLTVTPKNSLMCGEEVSFESSIVIEAGPGLFPFELRFKETGDLSTSGSIRVVSYNTLADLYADSDFSRTILYPYCPFYALHIDYRKQLLVKELQGYNADLICLQEVDRKIFNNTFKASLVEAGLDAVHLTKAGDIKEGMVTAFRLSKFRLLGQHDICIAKEIENNPDRDSLMTKITDMETLKEKVLGKTTVLQVTVLESLDKPGEIICVGNTHLHFRPTASHIRLLQIITCMQHLENVVKNYQSQDKRVSMVFCGDFNSTPQYGVNEFMTTGQIPHDHTDWSSGGEEETIKLTEGFRHSFTLESGCGYPPYTNFVGGFCGTLDYIYVDTSAFRVKFVVSNPSDEEVTQYTALPSIVFPSDHIAQICEIEFK